jgi:hypothetical protein
MIRGCLRSGRKLPRRSAPKPPAREGALYLKVRREKRNNALMRGSAEREIRRNALILMRNHARFPVPDKPGIYDKALVWLGNPARRQPEGADFLRFPAEFPASRELRVGENAALFG